VRPGSSGRTYIGFAASAVGAKSFVLAPNTGDIRFQDNPGFGYTELTVAPFSFVYGQWYYAEIEITGATTAVGRLYDSDGMTLLGTVSQDFGAPLVGGAAIRAFGTHDIDTFRYCGG
jgi:hypothetical protein